MKKYLAALLAIVLALSLSVPAFAEAEENVVIGEKRTVVIEGAEELDDTPVLNTDVTSATYDMIHFDDRKDLEDSKQDELEDSYNDLFSRIGENATFSEYWFESDVLPIDVIVTIEDKDQYEDFSYQYWEDNEWKELKHVFNEDTIDEDDLAFDKESKSADDQGSKERKLTVTLTIEHNGPIAIISTYGSSIGGFRTASSIAKEEAGVTLSVQKTPVAKRGNQTADMPTVIATTDEDVVIVPYKDMHQDLELINDTEWEYFKDGYKQLKDQVPEGMTTRYIFYLKEDEPSEVVLRMDDIETGAMVKCKMYNGSWQEQSCKVEKPGRVNVHADSSGFFAIFTEIEEA